MFVSPNRPDILPDLTLTNMPVGTQVSADDGDSSYGRGLLVFINITAITGTSPTLTVTIQGKDTVSGTYYNILSSAALTATGLTVLRVYPTLPAVANLTAQDLIPLVFRVQAVAAGTGDSISATINCQVVD